jgi:hypothetical protein
MKGLYLVLHHLIWIVSAVHFFTVCTFLVFWDFLRPRWNDWQRWFSQHPRVARVGFEVKRAQLIRKAPASSSAIM